MSDPKNNEVPAVNYEEVKVKPLPVVLETETKHYYCAMVTANFIRKDGKKISFQENYFDTNLKADKEYLDEEIKNANPLLRYATQEEIDFARMRRNPRATIRAQIQDEVTAQVRADVQNELLSKLKALGVDVSAIENETVANPDAAKLAGTSSGNAMKERLAALKNGTPIASQPAPLGGIVNTAQIAAAAAGN
jgi:hypothetical protein